MKRFAAAVTLMGVSFATAAVPAPLLEFLQQGRRFPTRLLTFAFSVRFVSLPETSLLARSLPGPASCRQALPVARPPRQPTATAPRASA
jgi:hypothetical protein